MIEYPQHKKLSDEYIIGKIAYFLAEDIPNGDITTESTISDNSEITAEIYAAEKFVFAGSIASVFTSNEDALTSIDAPC